MAECGLSDVEPQDEDVNEALRRLLAWPEMARSAQLAGFLRYIVERRLRGEAPSIKAYSIAVDVFGRPDDFDPQADPIVRVQARRLRALLEQYYQGPGAAERVRIELPTGRYVPEFVLRESSASTAGQSEDDGKSMVPSKPGLRKGHVTPSWFVLTVGVFGAVILVLALSIWGQRQEVVGPAAGVVEPPRVTVLEFQNLAGDPVDVGLTAGLAVELVTDLQQFETLAVSYGDSAATDGDSADYLLSGIVRRDTGKLQYSAILTESMTRNVVWNRVISFDGDETSRADLLDYVSGRLSLVLGSARGPLHVRARALLAQGISIEGQESPYLCRMLFDIYRDRASQAERARAAECYAALGEVDRNAGPNQAAMASLVAETAMASPSATPVDDSLAMADERMGEAMAASPVSAFVWEQRARLYEIMGRHDAAEAAYSSSLQLNPASADAMAARARHLALLGRLDAAATLIAHAIGWAPDPPAWYLCVPVLLALREGNYAAAVEHAELYASADRELGPVLAVMAGQGLHVQDVVNRYLPRVLEVPSFRANGVLTQLRKRVRDESLLWDIRAALLGAGVHEAALDKPF